MSDPYAQIAEMDPSLQENLSDVLELRGSDQQQKAMLSSYLSKLALPESSQVLEVGCGTGVVSRYLTTLENVTAVVGLDPSSVFVGNAKALSKDIAGLSYVVGDARALDFSDESFDLVVFHTSLCHIPTPEKALAEAHRVLRPSGSLAVFDGDYVSVSVALDQCDPLQACIEKMVENFVENKWLSRQLPAVLSGLGFNMTDFRVYGYSGVNDPSYMTTLIERGIQLMSADSIIGSELASAMLNEVKRRVDSGQFFGQVSYISAIATK